MKAITIHQPWAGLISIGAKRFETRGWKTNYRGPIAIHAGKKDPHSVMLSLPHHISTTIYSCFYENLGIQSGALRKMNVGCIVATANLTGCYEIRIDHTGDAVLLSGGVPYHWIGRGSPEFSFGFYDQGRYAWEMNDVHQLSEPIPAKGQQGLWNWEPLPKAHESTESIRV